MNTEKRIYWTTEEVDLIAVGAAAYLKRLGKASTTSSRDFCSAVRVAQLELSEDRRRTITGVHCIGQVIDAITARFAEPEPKHEAPAAPVVEAPKPELVDVSIEQLLAMLTPKLLDQLADKIADRVVERLGKKTTPASDILRQYMPGVDSSQVHNVKVIKPKAEKPVIMVVGLKNDQRHILEKHFHKDATFKFYGKSLPKNVSSVSCDFAVGMVGFVSHPIDGILHDTFKGRYSRVSNGMTQLESKLHELCKRFDNNR